MSRISRLLARDFKRINGEYKWYHKMFEVADDIIYSITSPINQLYYNIKYFLWNLTWLIPHAWKWRGWDSSYSIDLFCDSLDKLGMELKRCNNLKHSERNYRRCLRASKQLRKAADGYYSLNDKSYNNLMSRSYGVTTPIDRNYNEVGESDAVFYRWDQKFKAGNAMGMDPKEYDHKMSKIIHKRIDKAEKEDWEEAWKFIQKHIRYWWD